MSNVSSTRHAHALALVALAAAALFWGNNAVAAKLLFAPDASVRFDGFGLVVARAAWSAPLFLALALRAWPRHVSRVDLVKLVLAGLFFGPGCMGCYTLGVQFTSAAHAALLFALGPVVTAALAAVVLRERLDPPRFAALALGVVGTVVLTTTRSASGSGVLGDLLVCAMIAAFAVLTILVRDLSARLSPQAITGIYGTVGCLAIVAVGVVTGRGPEIVAPLHADLREQLWFFIEVVVGLSVLSQLAQSFALRELPATLVSVVGMYGSVLVGVFGSVVIVGETISPWGMLAGTVLALALGLALLPSRAHAAATAPSARPASGASSPR